MKLSEIENEIHDKFFSTFSQRRPNDRLPTEEEYNHYRSTYRFFVTTFLLKLTRLISESHKLGIINNEDSITLCVSLKKLYSGIENNKKMEAE